MIMMPQILIDTNTSLCQKEKSLSRAGFGERFRGRIGPTAKKCRAMTKGWFLNERLRDAGIFMLEKMSFSLDFIGSGTCVTNRKDCLKHLSYQVGVQVYITEFCLL